MFVSFMPEMYAEVLERVSVECPETKQTFSQWFCFTTLI